MKITLLIAILCLIVFVLGMAFEYGLQVKRDYAEIRDLPIHPASAIWILEGNRDTHQYFVDYPEEIWWDSNPGAEAEHVRRYNLVIDLIKVAIP